MDPVRVKVWGLVRLTRPWFLGLQAAAATLLLMLFVMGLVVRSRVPIPTDPALARAAGYVALLRLLPGVALVLGGLLGLETVLVLRRFRREADRQRKRPSGANP